jgi:hypothetical protein
VTSRTKLHLAQMELVKVSVPVLKQLDKVGDRITNDVKSSVSGSKRLAQFGKKMGNQNTATGIRVGTSWGPAVPIEYGTVNTPPKRILLGAAEKNGTVEFK